MGIKFWILRFLFVMVALFLILTSVQLFKGHEIALAAWHGLVWAVVSAGVFTIGRFLQARRGQRCEICNDIPESGPTSPRE